MDNPHCSCKLTRVQGALYDDDTMNAVLLELPSKSSELAAETVTEAENLASGCAASEKRIDVGFCGADRSMTQDRQTMTPSSHLYQLQMNEDATRTDFRIDVPPNQLGTTAGSDGRWFALFTEHLPYEYVDPALTGGLENFLRAGEWWPLPTQQRWTIRPH